MFPLIASAIVVSFPHWFTPFQVQPAHADLREHGARPRGARHLLVLLRARALVLCREKKSLSRPAPPQLKLVAQGMLRHVSDSFAKINGETIGVIFWRVSCQ